MNASEVSTLLRFCSSVDGWLKGTSAEEAAVMVAGWGLLLQEVPAEVAMRAARAHYAQGEARTITPGDIVEAWAAERRRERQAAADAAGRAEAVSIQDAVPAMFGSGAQYLADMMAAVERGEDPGGVPRPAGVRVRRYSPDAERRERACRFPDVCACTHEECRDGWLDAETHIVSDAGRRYPAAEKCPQCDDGLKMAEERGLVRKPRRAYAGGR